VTGKAPLQWGGRFSGVPDPALIAFGSSLDEDLVLAPFDVLCSLAHVAALEGGGIVDRETARQLRAALGQVENEVAGGAFPEFARQGGFEDVHGAIDARVREYAGEAGALLHSGRSRNDQVATTLLLYTRDRATAAADLLRALTQAIVDRARLALGGGAVLSATTHWQPAQPISLAFYLGALAESLARAVLRFDRVAEDAARSCPLGSGAASGSTLPLDRASAAHALGFEAPSRNAMDAIGNRDVALDLLHAMTRALIVLSRASEEFVIWCTPAFGYARLGDEASTGSSLMPQKRNPDPFELVRASAHAAIGDLGGALGSTASLALSYHRDLQTAKRIIITATERGLAAIDAFSRAFSVLRFDEAQMSARARDGFTVATDIADRLIAGGATARQAHEAVGRAVLNVERSGRRELAAADLAAIARETGIEGLEAPLDPQASVLAKQTSGSTHPRAVANALDALERSLSR
jgi:argininosuccinate lyase